MKWCGNLRGRDESRPHSPQTSCFIACVSSLWCPLPHQNQPNTPPAASPLPLLTDLVFYQGWLATTAGVVGAGVAGLWVVGYALQGSMMSAADLDRKRKVLLNPCPPLNINPLTSTPLFPPFPLGSSSPSLHQPIPHYVHPLFGPCRRILPPSFCFSASIL